METEAGSTKAATNVRLLRSLLDRVDAYAGSKGISRNAAISILLDRALTAEEDADRPAT